MEWIKVFIALTGSLVLGRALYKFLVTLQDHDEAMRQHIKRHSVSQDTHNPAWPYDSRSR